MPFSAFLDARRQDCRDLAAALQPQFSYVTVLGCDVRGDLLQMVAVEMKERPAFRAFQMKMMPALPCRAVRSGILPAGAPAVIKCIAADKPLRFELFELPVDRRCTDRRSAGAERDQKIGCRDMVCAVRCEILQHTRLMLCLISASARHDPHLRT